MVRNKRLMKAGQPKEKQAWWLAQRIAKVVLTGKAYDFTRGATFYHTKQVDPKWRLAMMRVRLIGQHIFYKLA